MRALLECALELAERLAALHDRGDVHGEVTSHLVRRAPRSASAMGRRRRWRDTTRGGTADGAFRDFRCLAPEQVLGEGFDQRADVYAFGAALYECLTGTPAVRASTIDDAGIEVVFRTPPRARSLNPAVPAALDEVLARAMRKDLASRTPSIRAMAAEIHPIIQALPSHAAAPVSRRPAGPARGARTRLKLAAACLGVLVCAAMLPPGQRAWQTAREWMGVESAGGPARLTLLLLPFDGSGMSEALDYSREFTTGIERRLVSADGLRVVRLAAGQAAGAPTLVELAGRAKASVILTGTMKQHGREFATTVTIVEVSRQQVIWTAQYRSEPRDFPAVQDEIALDVTEALGTGHPVRMLASQ